jgi:hypothetical protein
LLASFFLSLPLYAAQEYTGKVVTVADEILSGTTNAYDRGWVDYAAKLGQIVRPTVYNSEGKIVQPGTILIYGNADSWEPYVQADIIQLSAAGKIKDLAYDKYVRYKGLTKKEAVSKQDFTSIKSSLAGAIGNYENDITALEDAKLAAILPVVRAVFEGIVTNVTQGSGSDLGGAPVVEVVQLNPIGIKIEMPVEEQKKITHSVPIKIYIKGVDKPLVASRMTDMITSTALLVGTKNYPVLENNTILKDSGIPVLREWQGVSNFDFQSISSKSLAVPLNAVQSDEKGTYVWRAKGQKVMQVNKGIEYKFPIEKVYIKQGDLVRYQSGYTKVISLKDNGGLEKYELVLNNPPAGLKDGETVVYPQQAYLLMPGDEVRVVIGDGKVDKVIQPEKKPEKNKK